MTKSKEDKLTQVQKNYFVKRIDEIAGQKMAKITCSPNLSYIHGMSMSRYVPKVADKSLDTEVLMAITKGTIKLRTRKDVMEALKDKLLSTPERNTRVTVVNALEFIDDASLIAFNRARNEKTATANESKKAKMNAVRNEAAKIKDTIMLEGKMAAEMIKDFENKEF